MARVSAVITFVLFALAQCSTVAIQAREQSLEKAWTSDLDGTMKNPVKRVVRLLEEMRTELEKESDDEQKTYDKLMCSCATNKKEKTAALESATAETAELASAIESRIAQSARLKTKIADLKEQIQADDGALKTAVAMREKEAGKFSSENEETLQTVDNLKNAMKVLGKHQGSSLLQLGSPVMASMQAVLQDATLKRDMILAARPRTGRLGAPKRKPFASLLAVDKQEVGKSGMDLLNWQDASGLLPTDIAQSMLARVAKQIPATESFIQGPSYNSQSGGIFGIISTMKEEFEADMGQGLKDEKTAAADFKELSRTKTEQIASGKEKLDMLQEEYSDNQMALANAEEDRELSSKEEAANTEFLQKLDEDCKKAEAKFSERSQTRSEEIKAIGEALGVLTDDDNREQLEKNQALGFLQMQSVSTVAMQLRRSKAMSSLKKALHNPRFEFPALSDDLDVVGPKAQLATLAVSVQLDGFTKVKAEMDKMIADLKNEQQEEVKFKANCVAEFNSNQKAIMKKKDQEEDFAASAAKVARRIEALRAAIATAKAHIGETQAAINEATEARKSSHVEFQGTVADQQATQSILKKALKKLQAFYNKKTALIEMSETASKYSKSAGASPVMALLEHIISESAALEKEAVAGDAEAQASYESFVKQSNGVIEDLSAEVAKKTEKAATSEAELGRTRGDEQRAQSEVESLNEYRGDLHEKCDFVLKNFDARQEGRTHTMEEIEHTKAILSGGQ